MSPTRTKEPPEAPSITDDAELARAAAQIFEDDLADPDAVQADIDAVFPPHDVSELDPRRGLHKKLAEVILEVTYVQKTGTAPRAMGGYSFVEAGKIAAKLREALARRNITMLPEYIEQVGELEHIETSGRDLLVQTIKQTWRLTDADTGETAVIQSMGTGGDTGDKFSPKAQTNAMKYALQVGFLLETGDDPEYSDLSDTPQGPGVEIGDSNIEGVRQGGRQTQATTTQIDQIRNVAGQKELTPEALAAFIGATLGGKTPEFSEEDDIGDKQRAVLDFLKELSFEECGLVVQGLGGL